MENELVSVIMLSYHHSAYIRKALDSVLCQKATFSYKIVIGDDASPDHTQEIIQSYVNEFPNYFRAYLRKENLGMNRNFIDLISHCKGKYLAFLECDDYWCNDYKLQRQVEFLEAHPDYSAVSAQCMRISPSGEILEPIIKKYCQRRNYDLKMLDNYQLPGHMSTWLMKNIFPMPEFPLDKMLLYPNCTGDRLFPILLLYTGKFGCMPELVSAYRFDSDKDSTSWSSSHLNLISKGDISDYERLEELEEIGALLNLPLHFKKKKQEYYALALYYSIIHNCAGSTQVAKSIRLRNNSALPFVVGGNLNFLSLCFKSVKKRILHSSNLG